MRRILSIWLAVVALSVGLCAQEVLLPASYGVGGPARKSGAAVRLPFFDDFSNYTGVPDSALWDGTDAFVNTGYAALPPTVGVVTLDAVDADGVLHAGASLAQFSADTLCSQPIRLDSLFTPQQIRLQPSDSLYLSFYYLPGGGTGVMWERNGDNPEPKDSLILEFYNPTEDRWEMVWSSGGWELDALADSLTAWGRSLGCLWQYVAVPVRNTAYFSKDFRFRFRNYCSLDDVAKAGMVGNSDHWHIDYIYLDYNRTHSNRNARDVAFVNPAPSFLRGCQAMPARQFSATDMVSECSMTITNRYSQPLSAQYGYTVYDETDVVVEQYDGGFDNVPSFFPLGSYQTAAAHATPRVNFAFPVTGAQPRSFRIVHTVREGVSGDGHPQNDTVRFLQTFDNYYAYDDGSAENGYGLSSPSNRVKLAYRFDLQVPDTLTAIDLYFNHTRKEENAAMAFQLCVWADDGTGRPGTLLYSDSERRRPEFVGLNRFKRYLLEQPVAVSGTVYVGFEQVISGYINLGFDRGNDVRERIFYLTGSEWQQSILAGALMMRPCFGARATVGISDPQPVAFRAYPNPARHQIHLEVEASSWTVRLLDSQGRCCYQAKNVRTVDVRHLPDGVYILNVCSEGSNTYRKIVVSH